MKNIYVVLALLCIFILLYTGCRKQESAAPKTVGPPAIKFKDDIGILIPSKSAKIQPIEKKRIDEACSGMEKFLSKHNLSCKAISFDDIANGAQQISDFKTLFILLITPLPENIWRKLDTYVKNGGSIVWQGCLGRYSRLQDVDRRNFSLLAGLVIKGYNADPLLGNGTIERYMWIKPTGPKNVLADSEEKLFAVFAGEELEIKRTDGVITGIWLRRDRKTEDGSAVIVTEKENGKTAFLATYSMFSSARKDDAPEVKASRQMLLSLLKWMGHNVEPKAVAKKKKIDKRPLNPAAINPSTDTPRAMWIWNNQFALEATEREKLFKFCKIRKIGTLFLYTGPNFFKKNKNVANIRIFLKEAHLRGLKIEALDGWAQAVFGEEKKKFLASLKSVLDYNAKIAKEERFDGFQSDVEPGVLKEYHASQEGWNRINRKFLDLHLECRKMIDARKIKEFVFGIALFENYDSGGKNRKLSWNGKNRLVCDHFIDIVDYFAMMSYHDQADETIGGVSYEVPLAGRNGKKAWIGAETLDIVALYNGPRAITFYEEGLDVMEKELSKIIRHYQKEQGYAGIAIHFYDSYRRLPNKVDWKFDKGMKPPEIKAEKLAEDVSVDGRTAEWKQSFPININGKINVVHGKGDWKSVVDLSATAWMGWSKKYLSVFLKVQDNKILNLGNGIDIWKGDHVEIWLENKNGIVFQIGCSPGDFDKIKPDVYIWYPKTMKETERKNLASKISIASRKTLRGYNMECSIPTDLMGVENFSGGMQIKLLIGIGDTDNKKHPHESLLSSSPVREKNRVNTFNTLNLEKK